MYRRSGIVGLVSLLGVLALALVLVTGSPTTSASGYTSVAVEDVAYSPAQAATNCAAPEMEIPQAECQDLINLYTSTNGTSWNSYGSDNWNVTNEPCDWYGVTCDTSSPKRHVIELALDRNGLSGTLPTLTALTSLENLDLFNNMVGGSIPDMSALTSLKQLDLLLNQFTGGIPTSLTTLTTLEYLDLSRNQLDGSIPNISALTNLEYLDLSWNDFDGGIPDLSALTSLRTLRLNNNDLTGNIPSLTGPVSLEHLDLSWNLLDDSIPDLSTLGSLRTLRLNTNNLTGPIPDLSALTSLEQLYLNNNQLDGSIPALSTLSSLRTLNLSENLLTGSIPSLATNTSLQQIDVHENALTGNIPNVSALAGLTQLDLSENQLNGPIPNLPASLMTLLLDNNRLGGEIPVSFKNLTALSSLDLSYNMLMASDPTVNSFVDSLQPTWENTQTVPVDNLSVNPTSSTSVTLSWNPYLYIGDGGYFEISYKPTNSGVWQYETTADKTAVDTPITSLTPDTAYYFRVRTYTPAHGDQQNDLWSEYATVTYYGIPSAEYDTLLALYNGTGGSSWSNSTGWLATDTPCAWRGVTCANSHVTGIELPSNNLIGTLPALSALDHLETLDLGENQLTGPIPGLSTLTSLMTLDLSNNQLTGSIPGFPASSSLTYIALGNNQLDGPIPSLSGLDNLERLYLWNNQLTGDIPDLSALTALQYLNTNNNQLTGPFPNLSMLTNLKGVWLSGNRLSGSIPDLSANIALASLAFDNNQLSGEIPASLATLPVLGYVNPHYNQLTASDPTVIAFLESLDSSRGWMATQTVPVTVVQLANPAPTSIDLSWEPIAYTSDGGYYEIQFATDAAGPWSVKGQTTDKSADHYTVTGLVANTHYYFQVRTFTPAHGAQQSDLESYCPDIMEYHVYWTLITEQELFARMQDEMVANPAIQEIAFALADFVPGAIRINVGTANGDVGMVVTSLTSENGLALLTIDSITLDGAPAPADYTAIINRELMPLLVSTLNALVEEKMGTGLDLDSMRVTDEAIEAAFPP